MIIAVDGPAGSGKGTLSKKLAKHYRLAFLDTGLLYRWVGIESLKRKIDPTDEEALAALALNLTPDKLEDPSLRGDEAAQAASKIAVHPKVRRALLEYQRSFADSPPASFQGALLDGRDIGTRICPRADIKLFITADVEVRAQRRVKELQERGIPCIYASVLKEMAERDTRDTERKDSPLKPAEDAFVINSSALSPEQVFDAAVHHIEHTLRTKGLS